MVYSFARIGAALGMAVEDVYTQNRRLWVRLREKGGKRHAMPCLTISKNTSPPISTARACANPKGPLFRTIGRGTGKLTRNRHTAYLKLRMAAHSRRPRRWQTMPRRARRSSTTAGATRSASEVERIVILI